MDVWQSMLINLPWSIQQIILDILNQQWQLQSNFNQSSDDSFGYEQQSATQTFHEKGEEQSSKSFGDVMLNEKTSQDGTAQEEITVEQGRIPEQESIVKQMETVVQQETTVEQGRIVEQQRLETSEQPDRIPQDDNMHQMIDQDRIELGIQDESNALPHELYMAKAEDLLFDAEETKKRCLLRLLLTALQDYKKLSDSLNKPSTIHSTDNQHANNERISSFEKSLQSMILSSLSSYPEVLAQSHRSHGKARVCLPEDLIDQEDFVQLLLTSVHQASANHIPIENTASTHHGSNTACHSNDITIRTPCYINGNAKTGHPTTNASSCNLIQHSNTDYNSTACIPSPYGNTKHNNTFFVSCNCPVHHTNDILNVLFHFYYPVSLLGPSDTCKQSREIATAFYQVTHRLSNLSLHSTSFDSNSSSSHSSSLKWLKQCVSLLSQRRSGHFQLGMLNALLIGTGHYGAAHSRSLSEKSLRLFRLAILPDLKDRTDQVMELLLSSADQAMIKSIVEEVIVPESQVNHCG